MKTKSLNTKAILFTLLIIGTTLAGCKKTPPINTANNINRSCDPTSYFTFDLYDTLGNFLYTDSSDGNPYAYVSTTTYGAQEIKLSSACNGTYSITLTSSDTSLVYGCSFLQTLFSNPNEFLFYGIEQEANFTVNGNMISNGVTGIIDCNSNTDLKGVFTSTIPSVGGYIDGTFSGITKVTEGYNAIAIPVKREIRNGRFHVKRIQ